MPDRMTEMVQPQRIIAFSEVALPWGWMHNMSPHSLRFDDRHWPTAEHLFQAMRFPTGCQVIEQIKTTRSPMAAKMLARKNDHLMVVTRHDQDVSNMRSVVRLKLVQHPSLADLLRQTSGATLVEDVTRRQRGSGLFWGAALRPDGTWEGENMLGRIWMELRDGHGPPELCLPRRGTHLGEGR